MTTRQRISLMAELWPNACQQQGWREEDRERRLAVFSVALSFDIRSIVDFTNAINKPESEFKVWLSSANGIERNEDFTKVKALLLMLADRVDVKHNKTVQKRWVVQQQIKCLAIYPIDKPMGLAGARAYVDEIIRGKFKRGSRAMPLRVEDLSDEPWHTESSTIPSQLDQLLYTLRMRLHNKRSGLRVQAKHSMHDMNILAGLKCSCEICCQSKVSLKSDSDEQGATAADVNEAWPVES